MQVSEKYNYQKYNSINRLIRFEIKSWLGRIFLKKRSKIFPKKEPILLDLGVGNNYTENWIHADFFRIAFRFWKKHEAQKPEIELDLRYLIDCADNIIDGIYSCHTLEHLYPNEAYNLLNETHRILKPSKWLRIIVPDLEKVVEFYIRKDGDLDHETGCEAISSLTQNWGHRSTWDQELLSKVLREVGFVNVKKVEYGIEGADQRLIKEKESRKKESLVIEAQKPNK